ncbi:MAG: glutathione-disulfide reductase [Candidatus Porifericomitaceae bacterium WSBS_2022_MAG_OTU9]
MKKFDLIVIGGGSGGVRAARLASERGLKVALVERDALGGTCVNRGCVPKKLMVFAAAFSGQREVAASLGWTASSTNSGGIDFNWPRFIAAKDEYLQRLNAIYRDRLTQAGVDIVDGHASLRDANTVEVGGQLYYAKSILLATGGQPRRPDIAGAELGVVSDDMFHLGRQPDKAVVVGGGYIALEFACILHGLGCKTKLVHHNDTLLRGFDREMVGFLHDSLRLRKLDIETGRSVRSIAAGRGDNELELMLDDGGTASADLVLFAVGRSAVVEGLGLELVGLELDGNGRVPVDSCYRTAVPSIYAIGDVVGRKALTPVAIAEATAFVAMLCGDGVQSIDYDTVPGAVFTEPQLATVGLSEEAARERGIEPVLYRSKMTPLHEALHSGQKQHCLLKIVCDGSGRLLGMHLAGPEAAEIIQGFAVAVRAGLNISDLRRTIAIHPTMAEEFVTI